MRLPTVDAAASPPSLDDARRALGGRVPHEGADPDAIGHLALATLRSGHTAAGVVVFATDTELDVALERGRFVRLARAFVEMLDDDRPLPGHAFERPFLDWALPLADAARAFHSLAEGAPVTVATSRGSVPATLVERCRYGALVEHDGRALAVAIERVTSRR